MSEIRYCDQCGHANAGNARFCGQCRHALPALSPLPTMPTARPPAPTILQSILPYLIGVLGLSLIVAGILLLNGGSNPEPPPPFNPTATATRPTATLIPTRTPRPTSTPRPSPTATLIPTSTPRPTATPRPTSTPLPTNTPFPTNTPTPAPTVCAYGVDRTFAAATAGYLDSLGCPLNAGKTVWMAQEDFVGGHTFWREDNDKYIYVLYANGRWGLYRGDWREGYDEYTCGPRQSPPTPRRGFGWVWCTYPEVQQGLGNATNYEWGNHNRVQDFSGGLAIQASSGHVYILLHSGFWR
ncbi:MAG: hypothetical protein KC418_11835 [Anaerolineales bacterium]|nr:hypothetical protein [Anaerolineales bacterium]MCB8951632.1 hypothetical protein [Ardenticatenales bacterium]